VRIGHALVRYMRCTHFFFGREITKYTVINGVYIRLWPTLHTHSTAIPSVHHRKQSRAPHSRLVSKGSSRNRVGQNRIRTTYVISLLIPCMYGFGQPIQKFYYTFPHVFTHSRPVSARRSSWTLTRSTTSCRSGGLNPIQEL